MDVTLLTNQTVLNAVTACLFAVLVGLTAVILAYSRKFRSLESRLASPDDQRSIRERSEEIASKVNEGKLQLDRVGSARRELRGGLEQVEARLYPPVFKHDDHDELRVAVFQCRDKQLECVSRDEATQSFSDWSWFGDTKKGAQMVAAYKQLLLSAFNAEFDTIRKQMRATTFDTACEKLAKLRDQLERLSETVNCSITGTYFNLKLDELKVWADDLARREQEKQLRREHQKLLREQSRTIGKEIDTEEIEGQRDYTKRQLKQAQARAKKLAGLEGEDLAGEIARLEKEVAETESRLQKATSQAQVTRAGFIYVISNIGSFGEDVVKIGMTRRLEPMDRVVELGDASVPFRFDVHTIAFVEDAPTIERRLHEQFHDRRVNPNNLRKEFFRATPKEVRDALRAMQIQSDWYLEVEAREYRESQAIATARKAAQENRAQSAVDEFPETV